MSKTIDPFTRYRVTHFYHFCDRRNLPLIRELGGLFSLEKLEEKGVVVPAPGGNDWSRDADRRKGLHRYVHLCFRNNHPMEYLARQEGRIADSIFLQVHPDVLKGEGIKYTADVSNKRGVELHALEVTNNSMPGFDILAGDTEHGRNVRDAIRRKLAAYDAVPVSSALHHYGASGNREWRQYFAPDDQKPLAIRCPFHEPTNDAE